MNEKDIIIALGIALMVSLSLLVCTLKQRCGGRSNEMLAALDQEIIRREKIINDYQKYNYITSANSWVLDKFFDDKLKAVRKRLDYLEAKRGNR